MSDLIAKGEIDGIKDAMKRSTEMGMCTFDQALYELYTSEKISLEDALYNADSRTDLALRARLARGVEGNAPSGLSIAESPTGATPPRSHG